MLIINNGVPKSGSTWVNKIVRAMLSPRAPAAEWRNDWQNASIDADRLPAYVASGEWRGDRPVLIKMHLDHAPDLTYLRNPDVRMIVSHRNLPDSVLSWYHHQKRLGQIGAMTMDTWLDRQGLAFAKRALRYRENWQGLPGVLMCRYEDMVADAPAQIARIAAHLNHAATEAEIATIAEATQVRLKPGEAPRDGAHARTGGQSRAREELPPAFLARLQDMDAQAEARLAAAPARAAPVAGAAALPELVIAGLNQGATGVLLAALDADIGTDVIRDGEGRPDLPWPAIRTAATRVPPPGTVRVHKHDNYIHTPEALDWLAAANPASLVVLVIPDPARALADWHATYARIAASGANTTHKAWLERDFFATCSVAEFFARFAQNRMRYDAFLTRLLDHVPAARVVLVSDTRIAADAAALAATLTALARDPAQRPADAGGALPDPAADPALDPPVLAKLAEVHQRVNTIVRTRGLITLT